MPYPSRVTSVTESIETTTTPSPPPIQPLITSKAPGGTPWTCKQVQQIIESHGWVFVQTVGSHKQYQHPVIKGRVTLLRHSSGTLCAKTVKGIWRQACLVSN